MKPQELYDVTFPLKRTKVCIDMEHQTRCRGVKPDWDQGEKNKKRKEEINNSWLRILLYIIKRILELKCLILQVRVLKYLGP